MDIVTKVKDFFMKPGSFTTLYCLRPGYGDKSRKFSVEMEIVIGMGGVMVSSINISTSRILRVYRDLCGEPFLPKLNIFFQFAKKAPFKP
ncbi:MAG: hypothetical protein EA411_00020 [Saprospirales bacterium]|nr:MAG: hypothetical protein EA411_00020 [Saprospirales bacterium]